MTIISWDRIAALPEDEIPAEIETMARCEDNVEVAIREGEGYTAASDMEVGACPSLYPSSPATVDVDGFVQLTQMSQKKRRIVRRRWNEGGGKM